jgi:ABC-type polar amino acid transport system ATPase subunit
VPPFEPDHLTGGMSQRVAIATMLPYNPVVPLCHPGQEAKTE